MHSGKHDKKTKTKTPMYQYANQRARDIDLILDIDIVLLHVSVMCFVYVPLFTSDSPQAHTPPTTKATKCNRLICVCSVHEAPTGANEKRNHLKHFFKLP